VDHRVFSGKGRLVELAATGAVPPVENRGGDLHPDLKKFKVLMGAEGCCLGKNMGSVILVASSHDLKQGN